MGITTLNFWIPSYRFFEEHIDFEVIAWENRGIFGVDPAKPTRVLSESESLDGIELYPPLPGPQKTS